MASKFTALASSTGCAGVHYWRRAADELFRVQFWLLGRRDRSLCLQGVVQREREVKKKTGGSLKLTSPPWRRSDSRRSSAPSSRPEWPSYTRADRSCLCRPMRRTGLWCFAHPTFSAEGLAEVLPLTCPSISEHRTACTCMCVAYVSSQRFCET